jgi:hypothetical protein
MFELEVRLISRKITSLNRGNFKNIFIYFLAVADKLNYSNMYSNMIRKNVLANKRFVKRHRLCHTAHDILQNNSLSKGCKYNIKNEPP